MRRRQLINAPQPIRDLVPIKKSWVHHLQVVDSERLKSPTHFIDRTAGVEGPSVQHSHESEVQAHRRHDPNAAVLFANIQASE